MLEIMCNRFFISLFYIKECIWSWSWVLEAPAISNPGCNHCFSSTVDSCTCSLHKQPCLPPQTTDPLALRISHVTCSLPNTFLLATKPHTTFPSSSPHLFPALKWFFNISLFSCSHDITSLTRLKLYHRSLETDG